MTPGRYSLLGCGWLTRRYYGFWQLFSACHFSPSHLRSMLSRYSLRAYPLKRILEIVEFSQLLCSSLAPFYTYFILRAVTIWTVPYWRSQSIMTRTNQHPCRSTGKRENCIFESGTNTWKLIQQLQNPNNSLCRANTSFYRE